MSLWKSELHNYLIDAFLDPVVLFGNFIYYTIIGLLLAFVSGSSTIELKQAQDDYALFKYVCFSQAAFGVINNCTRLNEPRKYLKALAIKNSLNSSDIWRNVFLITITSGLFRIFITFWYSLMVYPIVNTSPKARH